MLLYANRKDIRIFNANSRNESVIIDHLNDAINAVDFLFTEDEFASPQEKLKMLFQLV